MSHAAGEMLTWMGRAESRRLVTMAALRPEHAETLPMGDRLGRQQPHRMGALTYATYAAQVGVTPKRVPSDFWTLSVTDDGFPRAEVACPCGATPAPEPFGPFAGCECERRFFFDGESVWAFRVAEPLPDATG